MGKRTKTDTGATGRAKPPAHLSKPTQAWWRWVVETYELEQHHLKVLQAAAEAWDRLQQARVILQREGLVVSDRFGMPRKHPAVTIEEQARMQFLRAIRELDLEGEPHPGYKRRAT